MTITYQVEAWIDCWQEIEPLWKAHAEETGLSIDPDNLAYAAVETQGLLTLATMRVNGELVGIHRSVMGPDLHTQGRMYAVSDGWFILPEFRKGLAALRLIHCAEVALKEKGVAYLYQASPGTRPLDNLLRRIGYDQTDTLYRRAL